MGFTFEFVMCSIAFAALASFSEAGPAASIDGDGAVDAWRVAAFALLAAYPFAAEARRRLRHEPYPGTTAVITGGSCGIGYELARSFAASGHHLALVGRSQDTLDARAKELEKEFPGCEVLTIAMDLARAGSDIALAARLRGVDVGVLVNNAGFGCMQQVSATDPSVLNGMVDLNCRAVVALTRTFLPAMLERRRGRILNVSSTAGYQPGPGMSVYYATKAFVTSFSLGLNAELAGTGVTSTALCPGPTATQFGARAGNDASWLFKLVKPQTAAQVAAVGHDACVRGIAEVVPGFMNQLLAASIPFTPQAATLAIARFLNSRAPGGED